MRREEQLFHARQLRGSGKLYTELQKLSKEDDEFENFMDTIVLRMMDAAKKRHIKLQLEVPYKYYNQMCSELMKISGMWVRKIADNHDPKTGNVTRVITEITWK
jgi:hypothetical protein